MAPGRPIATLLLLWACASALSGCQAGGEPSQDVEPDGRVTTPLRAPDAATVVTVDAAPRPAGV